MTMQYATQVLSTIWNKANGSAMSNVLLKMSNIAFAFLAKAIMIVVTLILKLICWGELKTTCDTVATLGTKACDMMTYAWNELLLFTRDTIIPTTWQVMVAVRDYIRVNITPRIWNVSKSVVDIVRDHMNHIQSSTSERITATINQSMEWLLVIFENGQKVDVDVLTSLLSRNPFEIIETMQPQHIILLLVAAVAMIAVCFRSFRHDKQANTKRVNTKNLKRSLNYSQSVFLNFDDEDEVDDPPQHNLGSNYSHFESGSINQYYPALSFGLNRDTDAGSSKDNSSYVPLTVKGPAVTTQTFYVYAPPSIDKEIPKVDIVGTMKFVKTGKVRNFVDEGARRLLILNYQDMTIELYAPKSSGNSQKSTSQQKIEKRNKPKKPRHSGINLMSSRNLMDVQDDESEDSDDDDDVKAWDRTNFESRPKVVVLLSELISITAAPPPSHSSVLEVSYNKLSRSKVKKTTSPLNGSDAKHQPTRSNYDIDTTDESSEFEEQSMSDSVQFGEETKKTKIVRRRNEFAFLTSQNAAEFQRIVLALKSSGKDISQLYELLEELHVNSDCHFPQLQPITSRNVPQFCPAGVALDDAWRCMNEISSLREGLLQYYMNSRHTHSEHNDLISAAAADTKEEVSEDTTNFQKRIAEFYSSKRTLIGIVDFILLFVNPLPLTAQPYMTPCGATSDALTTTNGIELHHERLTGSLLLQQVVQKASAYILAYYRAQVVVQDGWQLLQNGDRNPGGNNLKRLAFDNDEANWTHDQSHQNECYEPTVGKDVQVMMNGKTPSEYQGFSFVGMHVFDLPPKKSRKSKEEDFWLDPDVDPVDCIPSLRALIEKWKDRQFLTVMYFSKYSATADCHLYVRSLPVNVDTSFDDCLRSFTLSPAHERNKRLQISFQFSLENWSSIKRILIRAAIGLVFKWFFGKETFLLNKGGRERLSCPPVLLRHFATVRHFPRIQRSISHYKLKNYTSMTVEDLGGFRNWLVRRFGAINCNTTGHRGLLYDCSLAIKDDECRRVLTSTRIVQMDYHEVAMPLTFREQQNNTEANLVNTSTSNYHASSNDELYSNDIDAVFDILDGITYSRRSVNSEGEISINNELIRLNLSRADIERYLIACACDIRAASVRIIESSFWRGKVFPIDLRSCRLELRSGQFFQQGRDRFKNPVFYYRHWLLGPWVRDIEASIFAVLYRLESYFKKMAILQPGVKITVVILLGNPDTKRKSTKNNASNGHHLTGSNPMIDPNQDFAEHASIEMYSRLTGLLRKHYPERLKGALIVPGKGNLSKQNIRDFLTVHQVNIPRVITLNGMNELKEYINEDQLVTFAGGNAAVDQDAFNIL